MPIKLHRRKRRGKFEKQQTWRISGKRDDNKWLQNAENLITI